MAFITPTQFILYADQRKVLEYLSDTDDPIDIADLPTNPAMLEILQAASDEILTAALVGEKYTEDDLIAYAAATNGAKLRKMVSQYAWGLLLDRRKIAADEFAKLAPSYAIAEGDIQKLRLGERIFPIGSKSLSTLPSAESFHHGDIPCGIASNVGLWGTAAYGNGGNILNTRCGCNGG